MRYLEKIGKTIDSAVTEALIELGATRDQVDIEILYKGSKGFLGIGAKDARVRVTVKAQEDDLEQGQNIEEKHVVPNVEIHKEEPKVQNNSKETKQISSEDGQRVKDVIKNDIRVKQSPNADGIVEHATKFLTAVLNEMGIEPSFEIKVVDRRVSINISGDKMGTVIGKRGETLDSLQYLVNIVVNKGQEGYIKVVLDTENYRVRREETLRKVAFKIAKKAMDTKRPVALEPMNPYDRRIIHSVLQNSKTVKTHSEGKEPYRKIVISPIGYNKNDKK